MSLADEACTVHLDVNGMLHTLQLEARVSLLDALRDRIGLTGTKKGCDQGACGACTVLVDGERINACLALAIQYQGRKIVTIEGLADGSGLHPLQVAFIRHDGFQCGYCTPGQICSALGMLHELEQGMPSALSVLPGSPGSPGSPASPRSLASFALSATSARRASPAWHTGSAGLGSGDGSSASDPGNAPISDAELKERMSGNLCRCGAYVGITAAIREVLSAAQS